MKTAANNEQTTTESPSYTGFYYFNQPSTRPFKQINLFSCIIFCIVTEEHTHHIN